MRTLGMSILATYVFTMSALAVGEWNLRWNTIDGGGTMNSASASFQLAGTIGQPEAGYMEGMTISLSGGFWFEHVQGDCVLDGVVTLMDAKVLGQCLTGPEVAPNSNCGCMDSDGDNDIDLRDTADFQTSFSNP